MHYALIINNTKQSTHTLPFEHNKIKYNLNTNPNFLLSRNFYPVKTIYPELQEGDQYSTQTEQLINNEWIITYSIKTKQEIDLEIEQQKTEQIENTRNTMLVKYPFLQSIFNKFILICHIVNGKDFSSCKMGFEELIMIQNSLHLFTEQQRQDIVNRAIQFGYVGDLTQIVEEISKELIILNQWGSRYDIIESQLNSVGGWWNICLWMDIDK